MQIFIYIIKHPQSKRTYPTNIHPPKISTPSTANSPHASYTRKSLHAAFLVILTILQHAPKARIYNKTSRKTILTLSNRLQQPPPPTKFPNQLHLNT